MKKIVLASDNHYNKTVLKYILSKENDADMYIHCGDSELDIKSLLPFVSVLGNNDHDFNLPKQRFIEIEEKRIEVLHGNPYVSSFSDTSLIQKAKSDRADIVFFGHTHIFTAYIKEGIYFINPGSCHYNRDGSKPSYAIVTIDKDDIKIERVDLDPEYYMHTSHF